MSLSIQNNGTISTNNFSNYIVNQYDINVYTEPDNSIWIRIFHHNDPTNKGLFASTDTFTSSVYKDENRWFNVSLCNQISDQWELMIKQKTTSDASETKCRWIQSYNPMTATFDQTKAANITKVLTAGYSDMGGGVYKNNSSTYLVKNDGTSGDWFGAIGGWKAYQSGIPGMPTTTITTGYIDLYLRLTTNNNAKASFGTNYVQSKNLVEI